MSILVQLTNTLAMGQRSTLMSAKNGVDISGNDDASRPSVSADGRYVAFTSGASNLVTNDANGYYDDIFAFPITKPAGNYNGDFKADIAAWRPTDGNWSVLNSSGAATRVQQWGLGSLGDRPVAADYDGDSKTDLAVFRSTDNSWYILQSSDNTLKAQSWGLSTDKPVPADYDGDGKTDVAVWREATGYWYILRSSDGLVTQQTLGSSGDVAISTFYNIE
jgi:hypothetical protein